MSRNPKLQQAMDYVRSNGGDPKTAFYKLAEEKGLNPSDIENYIFKGANNHER